MGDITNISYPETQNLIEDVTSRIEKLEQQAGATAGSGNPSDLTPIGPWPIATKPGKNGRVIVTLRCAVPSTTTKLKVVLEEFTGTGVGVTVTWRINSADIEIPAPTPAVFDFDFPIPLFAGKKYGCIKLVSIAADGSRTQNPAVDFPDSPRNDTDYFAGTIFTLGPLFGVPSDPNCTAIGSGGGIAANALDPNLDYRAVITYRVWAPLTTTGAAQTWGASNVDTVVIVAKSGSFANKHIPHVLIGAELTQTDPTVIGGVANRGYVDITQTGYIPGDQVSWVANISWIGNDKSISTGAPCTVSAGGYSVDPTLLTSLSLSIDTTTPPYTSKAAKMTVNFTQPATPVALKNVKVFRKLTSEGSGSYVLFIDKFTLKHNELLPTGAQSVVIEDGARFKPSNTYDLQVVITAIGGAQVTFTRSSFAAGDPTDAPADTAAPTLATNPDTGTTGPTVSERHSKIDIACPFPADHFFTLDDYQVILSSQGPNNPPAGNPSVGSAGVLVIKYGQNPTFNLSYQDPLTTTFYVYFRAHNQFSGGSYSAWSASTDQHGFSRPLQDIIGTAVPTHPEGLARASLTSGSGHTTTTFVLDSGASAINNFYVGMALQITSPGTSTPATDRWRTITAYVGSTRTCTVDTAFTSAPSGSLAYDIHRIGVAGDRSTKSGTGHTTTTVVLDSGASAVTDFYKGYTIYIPSNANVDKIRKVTAYNAGTKTLTVDVAYGTAPSGSVGYLLVNGSIGYASALEAANFANVASPVPFRWYLDGVTDQIKFEVLPPTDENAFSLTHFQIQSRRENIAGTLKNDSGLVPIVSGLGYAYPAPSGHSEAAAIRFRNLYRDSGSDGLSALSYFVDLPRSTGDGGTPNYDAETFGSAKLIDYEGITSYPVSRYPDAN